MIAVAAKPSASTGQLLPDLTALLDVIFILLVFFLLTANVVPQVLEITLPEADAAVATQARPEAVTLGLFAAEGRWSVDEKQYRDWPSASAAVLQRIQRDPQLKIIVAGDKRLALEKLITVFSWLRKHNLSAASLQVTNEAVLKNTPDS